MSVNPPGPVLGVSVAVFREGKVLVARRGRGPGEGLWSLPGGRVEFGESLEAAALRELMEEVGVQARILDLAGTAEVIMPSAGRHFVVIAFAAEWLAGEPTTGPEASEVAFVAPEAVEGLAATPGLAGVVARAHRVVLAARRDQ